MTLTDGTRIVVEMGVEELDFLEEFQTQLLRYSGLDLRDSCYSGVEGAYTWGNVLEAYVRAREHYLLQGTVSLVIPQRPGREGGQGCPTD